MSAISRRRGVATRQTKVARVAKDSAAKGAAGIQEKLLIPVTGNRQLQLELALRRNIAAHFAITMDQGGAVLGALLAYPLGVSVHRARPLVGTSTMCAEVMTAGPPGAASRLNSVSAAHLCASGLGGASGGLCAAAEANPVKQNAMTKPIRVIRDAELFGCGGGVSFNSPKPLQKVMLHLMPPYSCAAIIAYMSIAIGTLVEEVDIVNCSEGTKIDARLPRIAGR